MNYNQVITEIKYLYHKCISMYPSVNRIKFKWELSPDIVDILLYGNAEMYYLPNETITTLFGYPVDINYSKTNYIKLWSEVK